LPNSAILLPIAEPVKLLMSSGLSVSFCVFLDPFALVDILDRHFLPSLALGNNVLQLGYRFQFLSTDTNNRIPSSKAYRKATRIPGAHQSQQAQGGFRTELS
jgi:hypothetical protein